VQNHKKTNLEAVLFYCYVVDKESTILSKGEHYHVKEKRDDIGGQNGLLLLCCTVGIFPKKVIASQ
jgi:hypothetical protein